MRDTGGGQAQTPHTTTGSESKKERHSTGKNRKKWNNPHSIHLKSEDQADKNQPRSRQRQKQAARGWLMAGGGSQESSGVLTMTISD